MKIIRAGSRAAAGEMIEEVWGEQEMIPGDESSRIWDREDQIRNYLATGRRAKILRPTFLWGSPIEVARDISRLLIREHEAQGLAG